MLLAPFLQIRSIFSRGGTGFARSQEVQSPEGEVPLTFKHELLKQKPIKTPGGSVRIVDSTNFPISKTIAAALVEINMVE